MKEEDFLDDMELETILELSKIFERDDREDTSEELVNEDISAEG